MAKGKKSFVLYSDQKELFEHLSNEQAGKLIKHIFKYVNDENPTCDDAIVNIAWIAIKSALKRDLLSWEEKLKQRSEAGKRSAAKRNATKSNEKQRALTTVESRSTKSTDNVNVNVNDNEIKKESIKEKVDVDKSTTSKTLQERQIEFGQKVKSYSDKYPTDMLKDFFNYWTEKNENGKKMRFEMQKVFDIKRRLATWHNRTPKTNKPVMDDLVKNVYKQIGYDIK